LALVAVVAALRDGPSTGQSPAVVAVRDLSPGHTLTLDDVELVDRDSSSVPSGALTTAADAVGHTLSGPVPAGEALVSVRMLGPRLAGAATGNPDARVVPIRLADAGVGDLLREGDLVDVLTVAPSPDDRSPNAQVLATGATVVLAHTADGARDQRERVVLLALAPEQAVAVAAASLVSALTVTLH
ncbi:MAG: SAF domain-containing protein, partial [Rhodococcus sp. (in: high G+C Gram-positive bacteria)]|uniref:SAF domain-containing protein n=1 Tax=Rhodococcus sp. TaxID=1831 RepID=UPI003BB76C12